MFTMGACPTIFLGLQRADATRIKIMFKKKGGGGEEEGEDLKEESCC